MQQIKFLEVKGEILDSYDELLKCKTDMQKALQMDKIKSIVTLEIFRNFTNFNQIDKEKHDYYDRWELQVQRDYSELLSHVCFLQKKFTF